MKYSEIKTQLESIASSLGVLDYTLEVNEEFRTQGMDSLDQIEFFMAVEKELNISLPDNKLVDVHTPHQLIELIIFQKHLSEVPEPPTV